MRSLIVAFLFSWSAAANAAWLNVSGKVENIITYAHTETILVNISANGASVDACSNATTFAISKDISPEARARMYAMLLAAQSTERTVVVSFREVEGCEPWDSNPSAYRQIVRLR